MVAPLARQHVVILEVLGGEDEEESTHEVIIFGGNDARDRASEFAESEMARDDVVSASVLPARYSDVGGRSV